MFTWFLTPRRARKGIGVYEINAQAGNVKPTLPPLGITFCRRGSVVEQGPEYLGLKPTSFQ